MEDITPSWAARAMDSFHEICPMSMGPLDTHVARLGYGITLVIPEICFFVPHSFYLDGLTHAPDDAADVALPDGTPLTVPVAIVASKDGWYSANVVSRGIVSYTGTVLLVSGECEWYTAEFASVWDRVGGRSVQHLYGFAPATEDRLDVAGWYECALSVRDLRAPCL